MIQAVKQPLAYLAYLVACLCAVVLMGSSAQALSGSEFQANRIIDDAVFYNGNAMTVDQIQSFLNSKVPTCDTNGSVGPYYDRNGTRWNTRGDYGRAKGVPPPYTCLKDFRQDHGAKSDSGVCAPISAKSNRSAAQIIDDVARSCNISQKALIVTLQKEQSLITDDWPWPVQYQKAMGYYCPDDPNNPGWCHPDYAGFFNQVYNAAKQFVRYKLYPGNFNHAAGRTSYVAYQANNSSCGGTNLTMQNAATAGLYNYTPYQPNAAALNNLYGTGDGCSAYGNRNFWRMFNDWFGSTQTNTAYSWNYVSQAAFSDSNRTQQFNRGSSSASIAPGGQAYLELKARNNGYEVWSRSTVRLGTSHSNDRCSALANDSWLSCGRILMVEESVRPGETATFRFSVTAPNATGPYREYFNLVAEGITWLNDPGAYFVIDVVRPWAPAQTDYKLTPGEAITPNKSLLSQDLHSKFYLQGDGNAVVYIDSKPMWATDTAGKRPGQLIMQSDGNLVLYSDKSQPLWASNTDDNPGAYFVLQTDGNAVIYSAANQPLWSSSTSGNPNGLNYVIRLLRNGKISPGQELRTLNGKYRLVMQGDGNLVIYSQLRAIWSSGTSGKDPGMLAMQGDGNLVIYSKAGIAIWDTDTAGNKGATIYLQEDGNLVIYDTSGRPIWASNTNGIE